MRNLLQEQTVTSLLQASEVMKSSHMLFARTCRILCRGLCSTSGHSTLPETTANLKTLHASIQHVEKMTHIQTFFFCLTLQIGVFFYLVEAHSSSSYSNKINFCSSMPFLYLRGELPNRKMNHGDNFKFWKHRSAVPTFPPLLCCVFVSC